ncbi:bifunctional riboflavin kinase/FAD synthetase [Candidatus Foliamicus sp.]
MPNSLNQGSVVTVGGYDGMHLGHLDILRRVCKAAAERKLAAIVFSFEPSPKEHLAQGEPPARLMTLREKFAALEIAGIDAFYCPPFDERMRRLAPDVFMADVLAKRLHAKYVVQGPNFRFGYMRRGDISTLREGGAKHGFGVEVARPFRLDSRRVSSSWVREALANGDMRLAGRLLGRPYCMGGRVVPGLNIGGAQLGYPTANIRLERRVSPLDGIFAVRVHGPAAEPLPGVASIGRRPTVGGTEKILEVHIFDFSGDLYGRFLDVEPVAKLRDEVRFENLDALRAQMDRDASAARELLRAA